MSGTETPRPALHIVRGNPTAEEIAALTAVVTAAAASDAARAAESATPPRGRWNDPDHMHRRPLLPGSGAWRAARR